MDPVVGSIIGAIVSSSLQKGWTLIDEAVREVKEKPRRQLVEDAEAMQDEIALIQGTIRKWTHFGPSLSKPEKDILRICIGILARLVDNMEDCVDSYRGGMKTAGQFAIEIGELKAKSVEGQKQLKRYTDTAISLNPGNVQAPADPLQGLEVSPRNCLLYSCMFPPRLPARRNDLVRRLLAEELAEETDVINNLEALVNGNNIESIEETTNGSVKIWQPTERILEGIQHHSMLQYHISVGGGDHVAQQAGHILGRKLVGHVRRLFIHPRGVESGQSLTGDLSHLRTLAIFPGNNPSNYKGIIKFSKYKVLRLLDLKECDNMKADHLDAICDLLLLKYLSFGGTISAIPRKISNLQQLETLDMGRRRTVMVFAEIFWLPKLKHLLGKFKLHPLDFYLKQKKIRRFLSGPGGSVLQTLSGFATGKRRGFPQLMIDMTNLKKVKVWCEATADQANLDYLVKGIKKFIGAGLHDTEDRSLSIMFTEASEGFLQSIETAPGRVTSLKLNGTLTDNVPPFVTRRISDGNNTHIVELCLSSTTLGWDKIITNLSGMDTLHFLKLIEDNLGTVQIQSVHFQGLKRICIVGKQSLGLIEIRAGALPQLVSLRLKCEAQSLEGIAIEEGAVPNLVSLHLLSEPLDAVLRGVQITSRRNLEEVSLYAGIDENVKAAWTTATNNHRKKPKLSFIPRDI